MYKYIITGRDSGQQAVIESDQPISQNQWRMIAHGHGFNEPVNFAALLQGRRSKADIDRQKETLQEVADCLTYK